MRRGRRIAQFLETLESGRASPASFQRFGGMLPLAQIYIMGKIARATLRPLCLQSNSDVASRTPSPFARTAPNGGSRLSHSFPPDLTLHAETEGFGCCAALVL